jgi:hypothetical protein
MLSEPSPFVQTGALFYWMLLAIGWVCHYVPTTQNAVLKHFAHKILSTTGERVVLLGPLQLIAVFFIKWPRLKI